MNVKSVQIMNIMIDSDVHFMNSFLVLGPKTAFFVREEVIHLDCGSVHESGSGQAPKVRPWQWDKDGAENIPPHLHRANLLKALLQ